MCSMHKQLMKTLRRSIGRFTKYSIFDMQILANDRNQGSFKSDAWSDRSGWVIKELSQYQVHFNNHRCGLSLSV